MNEPVGVLRRISYSDINKNDIVEANEILSEADYYPFGLQHTENSVATTANKAAEKYQYNAKEFQDELNLNVFDYGARNYDAAIGRWFNHDPLSEITLDPYGYTYNNPINLIDPTGMAADGWRINNETQEKEFNEDYKEDNTPKGYTYADIIIDKKEGKVYDQSGGITETSFVDDITVIKYSGLNPYYNAKPSGKYGYYVPDAMSLGYGANVGGLIFSASFNVSVVANHEDIALVLGGNFEFGLAVRRPGFGTGGTMGFHDNYGGNKDVLRGLAGYDSGWAVNAGIIGMSRSQSAYDNGKINPDIGVRSTTFTYGPGIGGGYVRSTSESFKLSNGIRNIKSMYNKWNF